MKYRITADANQFIVQRRRVVKGEETWEGHRYYATLEGLGTGLMTMLTREYVRDGEAIQRALTLARDDLNTLLGPLPQVVRIEVTDGR